MWGPEFKRGRAFILDFERSGLPANNRRVYQCGIERSSIAELAKILVEPERNILHNHLGMKRLSAQWLPRLLTADRK